jgi:biopolymer transport protein ExbD
VSRPRTRWEEDNVARVNVAAFVAIAVVVLVFVGLAVLFAVT